MHFTKLHHFSFMGACAMLAACSNAPDPDPGTAQPEPAHYVVDSVSGSRIFFANEGPFETGLHELKFIGQVERPDGLPPFLVMSGRYCDECDALIALYVHSLSGKPMKVENGEGALQHPGRLLDGETSEPYYSTRSFYGEVLPGLYGVVSYETVLDGGEGEWYMNLVDLSGASRNDKQTMDHAQLPETLKLLAAGKCSEIPGMDQMTAP